jgi:hypothetical protein
MFDGKSRQPAIKRDGRQLRTKPKHCHRPDTSLASSHPFRDGPNWENQLNKSNQHGKEEVTKSDVAHTWFASMTLCAGTRIVFSLF